MVQLFLLNYLDNVFLIYITAEKIHTICCTKLKTF